nr:YcdB/YcdC domain-containing protein [Lysinibacillus timonensis]
MRKWGILVTTTALSFGIVSSVGHAQSPVEPLPEKIAIEVQSAETKVSKSVLIKKFKEIFPTQFNFLTENDFHMSNAHHFPDDDRIRYDLSFQKVVQGKDVYGNVTFVGDNLDIENFYYQPANSADALFPAKVSKEDAQKIAADFLKKFSDGSSYELDLSNGDYYYYSNQLITEPIRYDFSFVQKVNNILVPDKRAHITVLGNGEIIQFSRYSQVGNKATYDDAKKVKNEKEILQKVKDNLNVTLKYQINYDYQTGEETVALVYKPTIGTFGVNALTGEWQTSNGFVKDAPKVPTLEKLSTTALPPKQPNITMEQAEKLAEQLLKIDEEEVKLTINSINEYENPDGQTILSVHFSYDWEFGGYGSSIEINKATGEILHYYDIKNDVLRELGKLQNKEPLSKDDAQAKAIEYLKEYVPSHLHNYAKPIDEPYLEKQRGIYNFTFPRVVNGVVVEGNDIYVSIGPNGSLNSLSVNHLNTDHWPTTENIITSQQAKTQFINSLDLDLQYVDADNDPKTAHYNLVYSPIYNGDQTSYLDATSGKWKSLFEKGEYPTVTHPDAEEELNYLIQNQILEVKDAKSFNADAAITNGEALSILVKSLSYFYVYDTPENLQTNQSFNNVGPDHPLYPIVERAVQMGILKPTDSFNPDGNLSREQLAVWYVRAIGLDAAAKYNVIYQLTVTDADQVQDEFAGYVALANVLKLISVENNQFNPQGNVSYADIAKSIFNVAHSIHDHGLVVHPY